ncbi:BspA family leucine-rich repeat surface protein [Flavobacterium sp. D11R37]|uniref:BspA family leucine-rich repeat surface protein n=1 Tax=Flavobacterium coralii TaxID=2838017 RepID=UPI001CA66B11|nr:BspA family leucine-rich repeat surface protein [Flavobacterium coralii]MBY8962021.1 BspA family leucine-rich repeat surface protein [Flavobacterium coralii]
MKKNYLLFIALLATYLANAQAPFITTWNILSGDTVIIPVVEDDAIPDSYTIDFGDGTILTNQSGEVSHTYANGGIYTVTMSGNFTRIKFQVESTNTCLKLLTIEQWGDIQWTSMERAFNYCSNLVVNADDIPDLSNVTNMSYIFANTTMNQSIDGWDVSNVTNMEGAFWNSSYNQPLNNWDVSNVTNMNGMFQSNLYFNQPLNNWDVSNVTGMKRMFQGCQQFNQPLDNWDVSNVTNMELMFGRAMSFDQPLSNWNVSSVINMRGMFEVTPFNHTINNWNVSSVTNMENMFWSCQYFNQPLDNWDVSNVSDMSSMFYNCIAFNQPLNNWNVSNVTDMEAMFLNANSFDYPLNNWDVSNVTIMGGIFYYATSFDQDISSWDFNQGITFNNVYYQAFDYTAFGNSNLSINNYDSLLNKFKELGLSNKSIGAETLMYCDQETRNHLINELGWIIEGDNLAEDCTADIPLFDENQISIYPNPVNDFLYIENKSDVVVEKVIIYNLQGRELINIDENLSTIKVDNLSIGVYIVNLITDRGSSEYKLIKN